MATGHIRQRGNGYSVVIELPPGPDGKRRQRWLTAPNKKAAEKLCRDTISEIESGDYIEPVKTTVAEFLDAWFNESRHGWTENTCKAFDVAVRLHIAPALGAIKLQKIGAREIGRFYAACYDAGLSSSSVKLYDGLLRNAFGQAVKWGLLRRSPCDMIDRPAASRFEASAWTTEQAERFISHAWPTQYGPMFALALYTGMRRGELVGLRWQDVDLDGRMLQVRGQSPKQIAGVWHFPPPKSESSIRAVPLRLGAVDALKEQRRRQNARRLATGSGWLDLDIIFDRGDGIPYKPSTPSTAWERMVKRSSLPVIRLHDTRHTAITLMLEAGVPIHIVAKIAGHSNAYMTERYGHVRPAALRDHLDVMDRLG